MSKERRMLHWGWGVGRLGMCDQRNSPADDRQNNACQEASRWEVTTNQSLNVP